MYFESDCSVAIVCVWLLLVEIALSLFLALHRWWKYGMWKWMQAATMYVRLSRVLERRTKVKYILLQRNKYFESYIKGRALQETNAIHEFPETFYLLFLFKLNCPISNWNNNSILYYSNIGIIYFSTHWHKKPLHYSAITVLDRRTDRPWLNSTQQKSHFIAHPPYAQLMNPLSLVLVTTIGSLPQTI